MDETTASHLLAEVDHVRNWLTAAAPSRPLHPYNHTHAYAYDDPDAAYLLSDYELSDPQNVYGGVGGGGYDDYESEPVAQRNSHRYHQELQRQQRSGVSAATLLGTSSQGRRHEPNRYEDGHGSSSQPHRLHQQSQAQRGSKSTSAAAQEEEEEEEAGEGGAGSAGHRVWGSPVRRDKPSSRIPGPVDACESTARTVANNRIK